MPKPKKKSLQFENFTNGGASDLFANTLRTYNSYDIYGTSDTFLVKVITIPLPVNQYDTATIYGGPSDASANLKAGFFFKGRIENQTSRPSPHLFLPDPCDLSTGDASVTSMASRANSLHLTLVSGDSYVGKIPSRGDIVEVKLKSGAFSFNLQYAYFEKLVFKDSTGTGGKQCRSLIGQFNSAGSKDWGSVGYPANSGHGPPTVAVDPGTPAANWVKPSFAKSIDSKNNWRYQQPTLGEIRKFVAEKGIKAVIRMNGDGRDCDTSGVTRAQERALFESLGAEYHFLDSEKGYVPGQGYKQSWQEANAILQGWQYIGPLQPWCRPHGLYCSQMAASI